MKTQHTKGEWTVFKGRFIYPGIEALHKSGNYSVVVCGDDLEGVQGRTEEEIMANAKLIAAAPELLESLNLLMETMKPHIFKMGIKKGFSEHAAYAQAQTAIKKATE